MAAKVTNLPISNTFNITATFGQTGSYWKNGHKGIDMTGANKKIYSVCDGEVMVVGWDPDGWGRYVSIKPDGCDRIRFILCHMVKDSVKVKKGDKVSRTTVLGTMGATGNVTGVHVHAECRIDNTSVDPTPYLLIPNKKSSGLKSANYRFDPAYQKTTLEAMIANFDGVDTPIVQAPDTEQINSLKSQIANLENELAAAKNSLAESNASLHTANEKIANAKTALG